IEREMKSLERAYAELERHRRGMPEDVLDQYVNRDAVQTAQGTQCLDEVHRLVRAGQLQQAQQKLESCRAQQDRSASNLEGALEDDPKSKWADATQDALDAVGKARPIAKELIDELQALLPRPEQIMSAEDLRALDRLRRRQGTNRDRTKRLSDRTKQLGG